MNDKELYKYIKNRRYDCCFCCDLQQQVIEQGLVAIDKYEGMVCAGIMDMQLRRNNENIESIVFDESLLFEK